MNNTPSQLANLSLGSKKKREATKCQRGHSDWRIVKGSGRRYCRTCKVERTRNWRRAQKRGRRLTFEERRILKQLISDIQRPKEKRYRIMVAKPSNSYLNEAA